MYLPINSDSYLHFSYNLEGTIFINYNVNIIYVNITLIIYKINVYLIFKNNFTYHLLQSQEPSFQPSLHLSLTNLQSKSGLPSFLLILL